MTMSVCLSVNLSPVLSRKCTYIVAPPISHCTRGTTAAYLSIDGWRPTKADWGLSIHGRWLHYRQCFDPWTWQICTETLWARTRQSNATENDLSSRLIGAMHVVKEICSITPLSNLIELSTESYVQTDGRTQIALQSIAQIPRVTSNGKEITNLWA